MLTVNSYSAYQGGNLKEVTPGNLLYEHFQLAEMPYGLTSLLRSCWCLSPSQPSYELLGTSDIIQSPLLSQSDEEDPGCLFGQLAAKAASSINYASLASNPGGRLNLSSYIDHQHYITDIFSDFNPETNKKDGKKETKSDRQLRQKLQDIEQSDSKTRLADDILSQSNSDSSSDPREYQTHDISDLVVVSKRQKRVHRKRSSCTVGSLITIEEEDPHTDFYTETDDVDSCFPASETDERMKT